MDFQSEKSFGKLRLRLSNQISIKSYVSKHVKDIKDYFDLWQFQHASTYINFGKPLVSAFQNFFQIENPLNIKEVMSKNMCVFFWHLIYVSLRLRMQNAVPTQPCVGKYWISLILLNFLHCNFRLWFETP